MRVSFRLKNVFAVLLASLLVAMFIGAFPGTSFAAQKNKTTASYELEVGQTCTITNADPTLLLQDIENTPVNTSVSVYSSDEDVVKATFDSNSGELSLSGVAIGEALVTLSSAHASNDAEISVKVYPESTFECRDLTGNGFNATRPSGGTSVPLGANIVIEGKTLDSSDVRNTLLEYANDPNCMLDFYDITLLVNDAQVHDGFGTTMLTLPVSSSNPFVYIYHQLVDGQVVKAGPFSVSDGKVSVEVDCLSEFALEGTNNSPSASSENSGATRSTSGGLATAGDAQSFLAWAVAAVILVCLLTLFQTRKRPNIQRNSVEKTIDRG